MARKRLYPPSVDPGLPVLGPCPEGWTASTFGESVHVLKRPLKLDPIGEYNLVVAKRNRGGIELRRRVKGKEVKTKTQFETSEGDFLISRRQIIHGACGVVPDHLDGAVVSNEYSTLRCAQGLTMNFLRHFSHTPYFQRTCFHSSHGVDVEKMIFKLDEWLRREVHLPPLGEQRKIAAILGSVDAAIERTQAVIDQVEVVKKALMQQLLTRGMPGRHTRFKQTDIGEIPESWEVRTYGELAADVPRAIQSGPFGSSLKHSEFQAEGILVVGIDNVLHGRFSMGAGHRISHEKYAALERFTARGGDLLITIMATVGRCCVIPHDLETAIITKHVYRLTADPAVVDPYFLMYCLYGLAPLQREVTGSAQGLSRPGLNKGLLLPLKFPVPALAEQREIVSGLRALDTTSERQQRTVAGLQRLKQALMSVLLTGELRVTPEAA